MNIYVSNLSFNVQDEDLREFFAEYGEVTSAKVITDKFTNKSRGFGFVEMSDEESAKKAIAAAAQKKPAGSHVTFGDNDEVIEKKPKIDEEVKSSRKKKNKAVKSNAGSTTTTNTNSLFQSGATGSILPTNPGTFDCFKGETLR